MKPATQNETRTNGVAVYKYTTAVLMFCIFAKNGFLINFEKMKKILKVF